MLWKQAPSSCPSCVLVRVLTRECVSGVCFRSKLPREYQPLETYLLYLMNALTLHSECFDVHVLYYDIPIKLLCI